MITLTKRPAPRRAAALVRAYTTDGPMFASAVADNTSASSYNTFAAAEAERRRLQALRERQTMAGNLALNMAAAMGGGLTGGAPSDTAAWARGLLSFIAGVFQRK